ncbi:MAG: hypothetical protein ACI8W8_002301 [Rhodothermales bacterium]|jgi:hypothetical protein
MSSRLRALLIDANGFGRVASIIDTTMHGVLGISEDAKIPFGLDRLFIIRMLFGKRYEHLGYVRDWRDAFIGSPELEVTCCNLLNRVQVAEHMRNVRDYDLIVILHSAAGDRMGPIMRLIPKLQERTGKLVVFLGNEHDLVASKKNFLRQSGAEHVCTQLRLDTGMWLYEDCPDAQVVSMPHALNPEIYHPQGSERTTDVGFVGALYDRLVGDRERTDVVEYFQEHGERLGLHCDIRLRMGNLMTKHRNLVRNDWCGFLSVCRAIAGAEAGSHWIDQTGERIASAKAYLQDHPLATFEEVHGRFYNTEPGPFSGKCVSSRHFEPLGTKTCQVLVRGHYNGLLEAGTHYIPVHADLSDIDQAVAQLKDEQQVEGIREAGYEYAMDCHTHAHRVADLVRQIRG